MLTHSPLSRDDRLELRALLVKRYHRRETINRLLSDSGVDLAHVNNASETAAIDAWHAALTAIENQGRLLDFFVVLRLEPFAESDRTIIERISRSVGAPAATNVRTDVSNERASTKKTNSDEPLTVFVSRTPTDKEAATRIKRTLRCFGIKALPNDRESKLLTATSAADEIATSKAIIVLASHEATSAVGVKEEIEIGRDCGVRVVPVFIDPVMDHPLFRGARGIEALNRFEFGTKALELVRGLLGVEQTPVPDRQVLEASLGEIVVEAPALKPLIEGCRVGPGVEILHMPLILSAPFHLLDFALFALMELTAHRCIAAAASCFAGVGAGFEVMQRWVQTAGDKSIFLNMAVGTELNEPSLTAAIELLAASDPPDNQALYNFIARNSARLRGPLRDRVLHLVTYPKRGPDRDAAVLAAVALEHFPDAENVRILWRRWVMDGEFDGRPCSAQQLATEFRLAEARGDRSWSFAHEALRQHVRSLLRDPTRQRVHTAIEHLRANADQNTPVLTLLLREMYGVAASAEWNGWREREPAVAEEMAWMLFEHCREASGERNWLRAWKEARSMIERTAIVKKSRED